MKKYLLIIAALTIASFSATAQKLTILHVNDTHSHIEPIRSGNKLQEGGVI
jgi:2',3'-cyclic-nucleotide 2'-phosphodiesterase (5'-nucleotidase family)